MNDERNLVSREQVSVNAFFFNDTATTEIYTSFPTRRSSDLRYDRNPNSIRSQSYEYELPARPRKAASARCVRGGAVGIRSEEHTSELQSRQYLVCRLLLEKKNERRPSLRHDAESRNQPNSRA